MCVGAAGSVRACLSISKPLLSVHRPLISMHRPKCVHKRRIAGSQHRGVQAGTRTCAFRAHVHASVHLCKDALRIYAGDGGAMPAGRHEYGKDMQGHLPTKICMQMHVSVDMHTQASRGDMHTQASRPPSAACG